MCASEISVGPVEDQPFEVMHMGREGQDWRRVVESSDDER